MNRKSRTAACRSPEQTRPRLLKEYRAPAAAACSHAAAGSTHHARMRSDQEPPPPGGPRFGQPGRPTREWSGRLAQTRGQDRQDYVQHGQGRPSVGETPANTVDVFLASAAPPARDSGCPPNRVNPSRSGRGAGKAIELTWGGLCRVPISELREPVHHCPDTHHKPASKLEAAYHR